MWGEEPVQGHTGAQGTDVMSPAIWDEHEVSCCYGPLIPMGDQEKGRLLRIGLFRIHVAVVQLRKQTVDKTYIYGDARQMSPKNKSIDLSEAETDTIVLET